MSVIFGAVTRVLRTFASTGTQLLHGLARVPERAYDKLHELVGEPPPSVPVDEEVVGEPPPLVPVDEEVVGEPPPLVPVDEEVVGEPLPLVPVDEEVVGEPLPLVPVDEEVVGEPLPLVPVDEEVVGEPPLSVPVDEEVVGEPPPLVPADEEVVGEPPPLVPVDEEVVGEPLPLVPVDEEVVGEPPPSVPADVSLTFWVSASPPTPLTIPKGSSASTPGSDGEPQVIFTTTEDMQIVPCTLTRTATQSVNESVKDMTQLLVAGTGFPCFTEPPQAGDAVYFGLSDAVPAQVLSLTVSCDIEGAGRGADASTIVWEAWNGREWDACEVALDTTRGLNRPGEIHLHVPPTHTQGEIGQAVAGWVRGRLVPAEDFQARYPHAPRIDRVEARTGGTVDAVLTAPADREDVHPRSVSELTSTLAFVSRVEIRRFLLPGPPTGERAEVHMPSADRMSERPVDEAGYERLALAAAPELARARCLPIVTKGLDAGTVRLLLVPDVGGSQLEIVDLMPEPETLERVRASIEQRLSFGERLVLAPALYQGITIAARLRARPDCNVDELAQRATEALYAHFHPLHGGPDGAGWPFGQEVTLGQAYALLGRVPGCEFVEEAHLFAANPITGVRGSDVHRVELVPEATVFSYAHQIRVDATSTRDG